MNTAQQAARQAEAAGFHADLNGIGAVLIIVAIIVVADWLWRHRQDGDDSMFVTVTVADVDRWEESLARSAAMADHPSSKADNIYDWAHVEDERRAQ